MLSTEHSPTIEIGATVRKQIRTHIRIPDEHISAGKLGIENEDAAGSVLFGLKHLTGFSQSRDRVTSV